jgi:hypothetical protein
MDKIERAKRLRKGFRANGGIPMPLGLVQKVNRTKPIPNKGAGKPIGVHFGASMDASCPLWVGLTETLSKSHLPLKRRRKGKNPLMRIADLYPTRMAQVSKPKRYGILDGVNRGLL